MEFPDLRDYLKKVEEVGELRTVKGADLASDIGGITEITAWSPEHPMFLFEDIPGVTGGGRIAVHSFDSYKRMQLLYDFPDGASGRELVQWWKNRLADYEPVPPVEVEDGPVMTHVMEGDDVDLMRFPAPVWHAEDAGPYLVSGGASVLRDPETGKLNIGCYRGMLYDRNTLGHHFAAGHDGQVTRDKWFARGEDCPILVSLGHDPSYTLAASENVGYGVSEIEFGGFVRGAPYQMLRGPRTGLPMLATAEVVLEGVVLNPAHHEKPIEGPWGEGLGYYAAGFPQPPIRVDAIYYRDAPIILGEPTLRYRNRGKAGAFPRAARRLHMLETSGLEGVTGIGQVGPFLVIAVKQYYSGQVMRIADFAMTGLADRPPRFLVMVDDDIDPQNRAQVEWAISSRVDPSTQVHLERERWGNAINPAGLTPERRAIEDYAMGTMIIDATKPFRWRHLWDRMFKTSDIADDLRARIAAKWEDTLGAIVTEPKPY